MLPIKTMSWLGKVNLALIQILLEILAELIRFTAGGGLTMSQHTEVVKKWGLTQRDGGSDLGAVL